MQKAVENQFHMEFLRAKRRQTAAKTEIITPYFQLIDSTDEILTIGI